MASNTDRKGIKHPLTTLNYVAVSLNMYYTIVPYYSQFPVILYTEYSRSIIEN